MHVDGRGDGIRVTQVSPQSPAARAGIRRDDVILKFAGTTVASRDELVWEIGGTEPGQRVEVEVKRGDETVMLAIVVGGVARPLPGAPDYDSRDARRRARDREPQETRPKAAPQPSQAEPPASRSDSSPQPAPAKKEANGTQPPPASEPSTQADGLAAFGIELDPVAACCVVSRVLTGSSAELAGLQSGDVILSVAERETANSEQLNKAVVEASIKGIKLAILRSGRRIVLEVR
jgi:S1-C subfamily serine protease